jgi:hypothetical protein
MGNNDNSKNEGFSRRTLDLSSARSSIAGKQHFVVGSPSNAMSMSESSEAVKISAAEQAGLPDMRIQTSEYDFSPQLTQEEAKCAFETFGR